MTPEGNLDDPADEKKYWKGESADGVELCEEKEDGINSRVSEAKKREESGVEEKPAAQFVSRESQEGIEDGFQEQTTKSDRIYPGWAGRVIRNSLTQ